MDRQSDGDAAGACADVGQGEAIAIRRTATRPGQGEVNERLRLGAGNEDTPVHDEGEAIKLALAEDVRQRLSGEASLGQALQNGALISGEMAIAISEEGGTVEAARVAHEQLGLEGGVGYAGGR